MHINAHKKWRIMSSNINVERICECCGKKFIAHAFRTRFCSKKCTKQVYVAKIRTQKTEHVVKEVKEIETKNNIQYINEIQVIQAKEYININETAKLLNICRRSVYNILTKEQISVIHIGRRILIERKDIENYIASRKSIIEKKISQCLNHTGAQAITEFYSINEITEKYKIQYNRIYVIVTKYNIPFAEISGHKYYSKKHIDNYFKKRGYKEAEEITEWYTSDDIMRIYDMTPGAVANFISRHKIPKKKEGSKVYYSKEHFDKIKQGKFNLEDFISVPDACKLFHTNREAIYSRTRVYGIEKKKIGKIVLLRLSALKELFGKVIE